MCKILLLVVHLSCALFFLQEADIAVAAYVPLPIRQQVVDFVYPYYSEYFTALYKKPVFDTRVSYKRFLHNIWKSISFHCGVLSRIVN